MGQSKKWSVKVGAVSVDALFFEFWSGLFRRMETPFQSSLVRPFRPNYSWEQSPVVDVIMKNLVLSIGLLIAMHALSVAAQSDWHREFPPFKVADNLYYVGTADLAVYLVNTAQGNILINSAFPQDLPLIRRSIHQLGFNYRDTKIILISHAHDDHDGAVGQIKEETGARLMVMEPDVAAVESKAPGRPGAKVDHVLHDGEKVELGGSRLTACLTPGHTPGCTTWTMEVQENGRRLIAVIIGSPNVNPDYILVGNKDYPGIAEDYEKAFAVLLKLPVDIFLGAHGSYFGLSAKHAKLKPGGPNPFIDSAGYMAYVTERRDAFRQERDRQKQNPVPPPR